MCNQRRSMGSHKELIRKSPHECLAHISDQDDCELMLRASGSFDKRQFVCADASEHAGPFGFRTPLSCD